MSTDSQSPPLRSWLFVPGTQDARIVKALAGRAHAVIIDLEDAVALAEKRAARDAVRSVIMREAHPHLYVRVNDLTTDFAFADIAAIATAGPAGIMLPKTARARDVNIVAWLLDQHEREAGLAPGNIEIVPILETAAGVANANAIARSSRRVRRLSFGAGDFTLDMGLNWSRSEAELYPYRSAIALASRTAGIEQPIDAVWVSVGDAEGMAASAARARDDGFQGKLCIHPAQVDAIHEAYRPSPEALARARIVVEAFGQAEAAGSAAIQIDGKLIDYPIVESAKRLIADAERAT